MCTHVLDGRIEDAHCLPPHGNVLGFLRTVSRPIGQMNLDEPMKERPQTRRPPCIEDTFCLLELLQRQRAARGRIRAAAARTAEIYR